MSEMPAQVRPAPETNNAPAEIRDQFPLTQEGDLIPKDGCDLGVVTKPNGDQVIEKVCPEKTPPDFKG